MEPLVAFLSAALLVLGSLALAARLEGERRGARWSVLHWVRAGQIFLATLIGLALAVSLTGHFRRTPLLLAAAALGALLTWWGRSALAVGLRFRATKGSIPRVSVLTLVLAVVVAWGVVRAVTSPVYEYDTLTYHLTFPATWCQQQALTMTPTWFGDPSPAYAPVGCEVFDACLMLATGDDLLARCGQLPFWLLLLGGTALLTRELRLSPRTRRATCLFVAGLPALTRQAGSAMVDVAVTAHVVLIVAFALRLARRRRSAELVGVLLSMGLLLSTKYLALGFAAATIPVLLYGIARAWPIRLATSVVLSALLAVGIGCGWYLRNVVLTGNPVYPMEVRLGPVRVFDGAYGRAQMENSAFNVRRRGGIAALPGVAGRAIFGKEGTAAGGEGSAWTAYRLATRAEPWILFAALVAALATLVRSPRRRARSLLVALSAILAFVAFWWGSPFQQPRFLWPALVLALVAVASARLPRPGRAALAAAAGLLGCAHLACLALEGLGGAQVAAIAIALGLGFALAAQTRGRALIATATALAAPALLWWLAARAADPRAAAFGSWRAMGEVFAFVDQNVHGATIAYTGSNVPYFLLGRQLENRVIHVPASPQRDALFHDYARSPAASALGPPHTSEPTPDRYDMRFDRWLENLRAEHVELVLVSSLDLFPNLLLNVEHDAAGFPIEKRWLDALCRAEGGRKPMAQARAFGRGAALVYRLDWSGSPPRDVEDATWTSEAVDALAQRERDRTPPGEPIRRFPHARAIIERQRLTVTTEE